MEFNKFQLNEHQVRMLEAAEILLACLFFIHKVSKKTNKQTNKQKTTKPCQSRYKKKKKKSSNII